MTAKILSDATGYIMFKKISSISLAAKVPLLVATCAALAAIAVGTSSYFFTADRIHADTKSKLEALTLNRAHELENYLKSIEKDLLVTAKSPSTAQAMSKFTSAWNTLVTPAETLQSDYITNNPNPTGEKHKLDVAPGFNTYNQVHKSYHGFFRDLMEARGYYDIFLIDPDGNLVYSVFKEADFATNLVTGEWSKTDLGNAFSAALSIKPGEYKFFDFAPYAPSADAPASFISTPIMSGDKVLGVLAFQMPVDTLNSLMSDTRGLGETGETIIVGEDLKLRNDSSFSEENDILSTTFETELLTPVLDGSQP
ncbi:MAG: cache domain-containing protein, partial [Hyphomicrobiales bacterium]